MGNGDISSITKQGKIKLPGGGFTQAGVPAQNKTIVWGSIVSEYDSAGIDLAAEGGVRALGLETLDVIHFQISALDGEAMANDLLWHVDLNTSTNKIFLLETVGAANSVAPTDGDVTTLKYWAVGDDFDKDLA
jgi:hypothetical protein